MEKLAFFDQTGFILTRSSAVAHLGWGGGDFITALPPNIGQPPPQNILVSTAKNTHC